MANAIAALNHLAGRHETGRRYEELSKDFKKAGDYFERPKETFVVDLAAHHIERTAGEASEKTFQQGYKLFKDARTLTEILGPRSTATGHAAGVSIPMNAKPLSPTSADDAVDDLKTIKLFWRW
jgi:hypothetical protein